MKAPEAYKILITEAAIEGTQSMTFKLTAGTHQKLAKPFIFQNRNQHINYEWVIFEASSTASVEVVGLEESRPSKIDLSRNKQVVDIFDKANHKLGSLTIEVDHLSKYPREKDILFVRGIEAEFTMGMVPKKEPFLILKYGDKYVKTEPKEIEDTNVEWKEELDLNLQEPHMCLYAECWSDDSYVGTVVIPIEESMNRLSSHPIKDIKDIEVGAISLHLLDRHGLDTLQSQNGLINKPMKVYVLEAILNDYLKNKIQTYINIQLEGGTLQTNPLTTTSVFSQQRNPKWNQSFQITQGEHTAIKFQLCERHEEEKNEEPLASIVVDFRNLDNGKSALPLQLPDGSEVGKLYIEVEGFIYDDTSHTSPPSKPMTTKSSTSPVERRSPSPKAASPSPSQSKNKNEMLVKLNEMKAKYSGKTLYDYYNLELNEALKEGLLVIAKEKPSDPVRQLGLFLINYKK